MSKKSLNYNWLNYSEYANISRTQFMSKLSLIPRNSYEMLQFLSEHKGYNLLASTDVKKMLRFYNATELQLDGLFILIKYLNQSYNYLSVSLETIFVETFDFFNPVDKKINEYMTIVKRPDFLHSLSKKIVQSISDNQVDQKKFMNSIKDSLCVLSDSEYKKSSDKKMFETWQENFINFLKENISEVEKFFTQVYEKFIIDAERILNVVQRIAILCGKEVNTCQEIEILDNFITDNSHLASKTDRGTLKYYESVRDIRENLMYDPSDIDGIESFENMFGDIFDTTTHYNQNTENNYDTCDTKNNYDTYDTYDDCGIYCDDVVLNFRYQNDNSMGWNQNKNFYEHKLERINNTLLAIGYKLAVSDINLRWAHMIEDCFVEQGLASDTKEIALLIYHIMQVEKDTMGYANKYDSLSLYEYFKLVSIANSCDHSYEHHMSLILKNNIIPFEYPVEILMRILSRLYDVNIVFYSDKLIDLYIDNSLSNNPKIINIFQASNDSFYNIIPIGTDFNKICDNLSYKYSAENYNIDRSYIMNDNSDISDIVNDINCILDI